MTPDEVVSDNDRQVEQRTIVKPNWQQVNGRSSNLRQRSTTNLWSCRELPNRRTPSRQCGCGRSLSRLPSSLAQEWRSSPHLHCFCGSRYQPDQDQLGWKACADGSARIWAGDGKYLSPLIGHAGSVWAVKWSAQDTLATASEDGTVRILFKPTEHGTWCNHEGNSCAVHGRTAQRTPDMITVRRRNSTTADTEGTQKPGGDLGRPPSWL